MLNLMLVRQTVLKLCAIAILTIASVACNSGGGSSGSGDPQTKTQQITQREFVDSLANVYGQEAQVEEGNFQITYNENP